MPPLEVFKGNLSSGHGSSWHTPDRHVSRPCYPCKGPVRLSPADMAVESRKEHSDNSRILTRGKNVIADQESRHHRDASDWKLDTRILIQSPRIEMGTIQCRSFCSMTQQTYFSWKADRAAAAVNAMVQEWGALTPYAFPRFILIGRVLLKIKCRKHI